jgi:NAD(P)-dependent dehydrogenase (short-subunit alcohol dehydrogenase family)
VKAQRAALVTGASRGIGLAMARALAEDGYAVTMVARRPESLSMAAGDLIQRGCEIVTRAGDVSDEDTLRAIVELHRSNFGRLDVLINNAGVGIGAPAGEQVAKNVDLQLGVNVRSVILLYRECLEMLKADGGAHVFNLSSITAKSPQPWLSVYSATKAAILAFTESMNKELVGDGVRSTALCPAFVDTDMAAFAGVAKPDMIATGDVVAAMRFVLSLSPAALVPEIPIMRVGDLAGM